ASARCRSNSRPKEDILCTASAIVHCNKSPCFLHHLVSAREPSCCFALHRSIAWNSSCVSPPLQLIICCVGILSIKFADTTSDRSALRTGVWHYPACR